METQTAPKTLELDEDHGVYVTFRYGHVHSFIAMRAAGTRQIRVSRVSFTDTGAMVLTFICHVYSIPEAREVARAHVARLLETQELAHAGGQ